jgi:hypothetical protein
VLLTPADGFNVQILPRPEKVIPSIFRDVWKHDPWVPEVYVGSMTYMFYWRNLKWHRKV